MIAEWIAEGEPSLDLWEMDVRRFGAQYRSPAYTHARIRETYETYYDIRYPNHERSAGRPLRISPANAWHAEHGAAFGEKSGWERVNWYESNAAAGDESLRPRGWAGQHWSPAIGAEHRATREAVAIFDESSFAKIEIAGPGAAELLERLCDNRVARERRPDHLHADAQPARRDRVRLHRRPARRGAVLDRHRDRVRQPRPRVDPQAPAGRRLGPGARRHLGLGVLRDLGPAGARGARAADARRPLERRLSRTCRVREITVGNVPVRALRVTYVGELGWELYCPTEYGLGLWRALWEAGEPHGIVAGGYRAIDSLRLEKGYRVWGADITPDETPYEGGLGFCVKLDKEGGFIGRDALAEAEGARAAHPALLPRRSPTRARSRSATSPSGSAARSSAG